MRKTLYILTALVMVVSMLLGACTTPTPVAPPPTQEEVAPPTEEVEPTEAPATEAAPDATATAGEPTVTATPTAYPMATAPVGSKPIRWFIGLGTGTNPEQLPVEQAVVDDFNADPERANDKIFLQMEVVPFASAKDTVLTEIAAGNGPDVIGPVGWNGSSALYGQWADLKTQIAGIPEVTKEFDPALVKSYESSEGQIGLPFAVFPSAIYYRKGLFDEAGLEYPPSKYGDKYMLDGKEVVWDWETTVKTVAQTLTVDANGKNATEEGFDKTKIVQYGFTYGFESQPSYLGTFWANGSFTDASGKKAQIPAAWLTSWKWFYDGVWGDAPFIPNGQVQGSPDFGNGNPFDSGKVAMIDNPVWYTCCMNNVPDWDAATMPSFQGKVNGRVDADTFRIWKGTKDIDSAFKVMTYLVTTGVQKLVIGTADTPPAYGALPARAKDQGPWLEAKKKQFPFVTNWDVITAGLAYPDSPSAEAYMPNYNESWDLAGKFYNKMINTSGLDIDAEAAAFMKDLQASFDKAK